MYCVKCPVLQQMVMTKKSTMLIKIMEMIMLIMVNKPYKFKRWRHIGSTSQFGDGGIHFSCWD